MQNLRGMAPSVSVQGAPEGHNISGYQIKHFSMQQQNISAATINAMKNNGASNYQQYLEQSVGEISNAINPSQNVLDSVGRTLNSEFSIQKT